MSAEAIRGFEFDWLAVDADGHVAMLSTAGGGYAPDAFLDDVDAHDEAIGAVLRAPAVTTARYAPVLREGFRNDWAEVAARGLFAYDSDANGGAYRRVAAPEMVATLSSLPAEAACAVRLAHLRFAERASIDAADLNAHPASSSTTPPSSATSPHGSSP